MKRIVGKLTYANIISSICLFLLLGTGAAFGARNLINGSKIKPHTITSKQIKKRSLKPSSFAKLPKGPRGATGPAGIYPEQLTSGKTLSRPFGTSDFATAANQYQYEAITFPIPLASAPTPVFLGVGDPPNSNCPGSPEAPQALPGYLCFYESASDGGSIIIFDPVGVGTPGTSGKAGTLLRMAATAAGSYSTRGYWAVTAP